MQHHPHDDSAFWDSVAEEFVIACRDRLVDCEGWGTFEAMERDARATFAGDVGLQRIVSMDTCWNVLRDVVDWLAERRIFPIRSLGLG